MTLHELVERHACRPGRSVPDWMLGYWKRHSISFANGLTDLHTHVCWMQGRNFTIDLRLPLERDQPPAKPLHEYLPKELQALANYEGWIADSDWNGEALSWRDTDVTLQLHNRWPEPAFLRRTGNCMIEHCPSNIYVEDWRLQPSGPGPLVGLRLIEEREIAGGKIRHKGGGLIVCGDYAALCLGRAEPLRNRGNNELLKALVAEAGRDTRRLQQLLGVETSVAILLPAASASHGYRIMLSTRPERAGRELFPLDGFDYIEQAQQVRQRLVVDGIACERLFEIDTMEARLEYPQETPAPAEAQRWFDREAPTLGRYLEEPT
jgi:hypothetical protein